MRTLERKWWTLIAVCVAIFMLLLDITVVNVALPDIQSALHASFSELQWVIDAYSLTLAAFLLTAGVIGDMFGRRRIFAIGLVLFTLASLLCGLSRSAVFLDFARGFQGIGGAIMFATSLALIASAFHGKERGTAFGVYGATIGGGVAIGPLIGGAITSGIGWRWIFFVNIPIGIVALVITLTQIIESREPNTRRIDWIGFISFTGALFTLVFALVRGNAAGWSSQQIITLLCVSVALLAIFVVAELKQGDPMCDLTLFRRPAVIGVSIVAFGLAGSIFSQFLYLTLFLQDDLGNSPLATGLRFLPITLVSFAAAPVAGKLTVKLPARVLLGTGLILCGLSQFLMSMIHADSTWTVLIPGFVVGGVGIGVVNTSLASSAISVVPFQRSGMASGMNSTFRQVGIATGIAALGAVFQSRLHSTVTAALAQSTIGNQILTHGNSALSGALTSGGLRTVAGALPAPIRATLLSAYASGFATTLDEIMRIGAILALFGAVAALALVRQSDFVVSHAPGTEPSPAAEPISAA